MIQNRFSEEQEQNLYCQGHNLHNMKSSSNFYVSLFVQEVVILLYPSLPYTWRYLLLNVFYSGWRPSVRAALSATWANYNGEGLHNIERTTMHIKSLCDRMMEPRSFYAESPFD